MNDKKHYSEFDIYSYLNDIPIDEEEIIEMETTDMETKRLKKVLKNKIFSARQKWKKRSIAAAAVFCLAIGSSAAICITNPAFASSLPIIGDIYRFLDNNSGNYDLYQQNSDHLSLIKENNGITITIEDALFDGINIFYTYSIVTDKDFGKDVFIVGSPSIKGYTGGLGGGSQIEKVSDFHYVGFDSWTLNEEMDSVDLKIQFDTLYYVLENDSSETVEGNWQYKFRLDAVPGETRTLNLSTDKENIGITIDSITNTPMSFILNYSISYPESLYDEQAGIVLPDVTLLVTDDLGNEYVTIGERSHSTNDLVYSSTSTFGKIAENATKLIVTPKIIVPSGGGVSIDENGKETSFRLNYNDIRYLDGLTFESVEIPLQ